MVATAEPSRAAPNSLLSTSELVHSGNPVLATLPQPAAIGVPLHRFPLESRAGSDFSVATTPDHMVRLSGVLVGIERHRAGEVPTAKLRNRSDNEDLVAPFGADFNGEGEGDGFGVRAGG